MSFRFGGHRRVLRQSKRQDSQVTNLNPSKLRNMFLNTYHACVSQILEFWSCKWAAESVVYRRIVIVHWLANYVIERTSLCTLLYIYNDCSDDVVFFEAVPSVLLITPLWFGLETNCHPGTNTMVSSPLSEQLSPLGSADMRSRTVILGATLLLTLCHIFCASSEGKICWSVVSTWQVF